MPEEITIRYHWTADELLQGYRWHARQRVRPIFRFLLVALAVLFFVAGALEYWRHGHTLATWFPLGMGIYLVVVFGTFRLLRPWSVRRRFAKRPDRDADVEWHIGEEGLRASYAHAQSEFSWQALSKVVRTPSGFLLYSIPQMFHWLPRHGFASDTDYERVSTLAQRHAAIFRHVA